MERRGIYRKGSAGHARNVNSYRLYMQRIKKWRFPLTALLALVLVFGVVPGTGEKFQTSLLTATETQKLGTLQPDTARKIVLNALSDFLHDCEKFKLTQCTEQGKLVLNDVINSGNFVLNIVPSVEQFVARFEKQVAQAVCKYELSGLAPDAESIEESLASFLKKYGDVIDAVLLEKQEKQLANSAVELRRFVESCIAQ